MNQCGYKLPKTKALGYDVYTLDLSYFIMAGGGPHCLINNTNQLRIVGGIHKKN